MAEEIHRIITILLFSNNFTLIIPTSVEIVVAINAVPIISVGWEDPVDILKATTVVGINVMEEVLITKNKHIAFSPSLMGV